MYENILVAFDGSDGAWAALARAADIARSDGAALSLVESIGAGAGQILGRPVLLSDREAVASARHSLAQALDGLDPELAPSPWLIEGDAASGILAVAEEIGADLIVTGSRKRGRVARAVLGSVSSALVQAAPCDVLVVTPSKR